MANRFRNSHICVAKRTRTGSFVRMLRSPFAILLAFVLLFSCVSVSAAEGKETDQNGSKLTLPSYVMDGMVLQQNKITALNGSASKSMSRQTISVTLRGGKNQYNASSRISKNGKFSVQLPKIKGSLTQYTMKFAIAGTIVKTVNDVYVGNLFIASGQSNMEINYNDYFKSESLFKTSTSLHYTRNDIPHNINDKYVHFLSPNKVLNTKDYPLRDFEKSWLPATGDDVNYLGYIPQYFAQRLRKQYPNIPIGFIQTAWGGTAISHHIKGGDIYKSRVAPLQGLGVAGVLWYQGEDDSGSMDLALRYDISFATLINDYRNLFDDATLPFLYVQLARYDGYGYIYDAIVRNAQLGMLNNPVIESHENLGMTVSIDTDKGTSKAIHPLGKEIVAQRMANQWIAINERKAVPSGPLPEEAHLDSDDKSTAIITFKEGTAVKLQAKQPNYTISATIDNIANATNTPLSGFQVADGDGAMHNVTATITGNTLRIHSDEVKRIAQIQYLWQSNPNCSSIVYNNSNLPMSPFTLNVNQKNLFALIFSSCQGKHHAGHHRSKQ